MTIENKYSRKRKCFAASCLCGKNQIVVVPE